ncbi:MAG: M48 family metalloprotease [Planctomycetota bacterium]
MMFPRPGSNMLGLLVIGLALSAAVGCGITPMARHTPGFRQVVRDHGPVSHHPLHQAQAQALLAELQPHVGEGCRLTPRVHVLTSPRLTAFAAAPRDVFVSEGLLESCSRDEVRAAIAHELGHLVESETGVVSSLLGEPGMQCPEARADHFAVALLIDSGHDPAALGSLLSRLIEHPGTNPAVHHHLTTRHGLLHP